MKKNLYCFLFLITLKFNALSQNIYFPPTSLINNNWDTIAPSTLGWCEPKIDSLYHYLDKANSKGIIVLKDGKIVLEKYFGTFTKDSLWYWASAGKSLTSLLIGIAQENGNLAIADPTNKYLGMGWTNCSPSQEDRITIKHQLTMTTGLDDGVTDNHCTTPNCLIYKADAGTRWAYHNAPYTLLEKVIEIATKQNINNFTNKYVKTLTGMNGLWLTVDNDNVYFSKARSMARYGILAQNHFVWDQTPLLKDTQYIRQMTNSSQNLNNAYGYLWWLNGKSDYMVPGLQYVFKGYLAPDAPSDMFAALGKNGQILSISPSKGIVVVRIGNEPGTNIVDVPYQLCNQIWQYLNEIMCNSTKNEDVDGNEEMTIQYLPIDQRIDIQSFSNDSYQFVLIDRSGKIIENKNCNGNLSHSYSSLENGVYFVHIKLKNQQIINKRIFLVR